MSKLQDYLATNPPLRKTVIGYMIRDNKVLLGVRIGGGIEEGESSDDALKREILEEIEVQVTDFQKVGHVVCLSPHHPSWNLSVDIYLVTGFKGEPKKTEDIDPRWYPKDELPLEKMWLDNRLTARMVLDGKRIAGTFLYGPDGQIMEQDLRELTQDEPISEVVV
jgi:8-oxo-dGTP diphosphatase